MQLALALALLCLGVGSPGADGDELLEAIAANDVERARSLLDESPELIAQRDELGATPLHVAARVGALEVARLLIERGASLEARDETQRRPLHDVREPELARLFLAHGQTARRRHGMVESPFEHAARAGRRAVVDVYVAAGEAIGLGDAAWLGMTEEVRAQLAAGADPNGGGLFSGTPLAPLHGAIAARDVEAARLLLEAGARLDTEFVMDHGADPLVLAVRAEHQELVELLLAHGAPVERSPIGRREEHESLLVFAIAESPRAIVRALCAHAQDLEADAGEGLPALHEAAFHGREDLIDDLLAAGVSIEGEVAGITPLLVACAAGRFGVAQRLAERGARIDLFAAVALERIDLLAEMLDADPELASACDPLMSRRPAIWAAALDRPRSLRVLLERGAPLELDPLDEVAEERGYLDPLWHHTFAVQGASPLHAAASAGSVDCLRLAIDAGADVGAVDADGFDALKRACARDRDDGVRVLLECGASPNGPPGDLVPPLLSAAARARPDLVRMLLDAGAAPNTVTRHGGTALDWAARHPAPMSFGDAPQAGELAACLLLERGADPTFAACCALGLAGEARAFLAAEPSLATAPVPARVYGASMPMHVALDRGRVAIVALLAEAGVSLEGETIHALHRAARAGEPELVAWLLARGLDAGARDELGATPLLAAAGSELAAARKGSRAVVELLLGFGADPRARDRHGRTALHLASQCAQLDVVELLLGAGASVSAADFAGATPLDAARRPGMLDAPTDAERDAVSALLRARGARD